MTIANITPEKGFEILIRTLNKEGPDAQKRVAAHFRAVVGRHLPLPLYHRDPSVPDEVKVAQYSLGCRALLPKDFSILSGQEALTPATGEDKRIDPADAVKQLTPESGSVPHVEPRNDPPVVSPARMRAETHGRVWGVLAPGGELILSWAGASRDQQQQQEFDSATHGPATCLAEDSFVKALVAPSPRHPAKSRRHSESARARAPHRATTSKPTLATRRRLAREVGSPTHPLL